MVDFFFCYSNVASHGFESSLVLSSVFQLIFGMKSWFKDYAANKKCFVYF